MSDILQQAENVAFDVTMAHNQESAVEVVASALRFEGQRAASTIDALVAALEAVQKGVPDVLRRECLTQVVEDALALARA